MSPSHLDRWLPRPAIRTHHRRASTADADELWQAALRMRLSDTHALGRLFVGGSRGRLLTSRSGSSFERIPSPSSRRRPTCSSRGCAAASGRWPATTPPSRESATSAIGTRPAPCVCSSPTGLRAGRMAGRSWCRRLACSRSTAPQRFACASCGGWSGPFERLVGAEGLTTAVRQAEETRSRGGSPSSRPARFDTASMRVWPSAMNAQAKPARQHLLRAHLDTSLPHVGDRQPVRLLPARLALELDVIPRGSRLHVPVAPVDACPSSG